MPKNQDKKTRVRKRAIGRVSENNYKELVRILKILKESIVYRERYKIGRVQLCSGGVFEVYLNDGKLVRAKCPGNGALEEYIKQRAKGTSTCEELQPLILILMPELNAQKQGPEVLAILNDEHLNTKEVLESFKYLGILWEKKVNIVDKIFQEEEETIEKIENQTNQTEIDDENEIDFNDL